jgi:hypothetical protein
MTRNPGGDLSMAKNHTGDPAASPGAGRPTGLSQRQTARRFGVSLARVQRWLDRGQRLDRVDWAGWPRGGRRPEEAYLGLSDGLPRNTHACPSYDHTFGHRRGMIRSDSKPGSQDCRQRCSDCRGRPQGPSPRFDTMTVPGGVGGSRW